MYDMTILKTMLTYTSHAGLLAIWSERGI